MDGYVITNAPGNGLALIGTEGVRYAARLDNGEGFAAFDGISEERANTMRDIGRLLVVSQFEPIPDYPPSWERPTHPKRAIGNGNERFSLVLDDSWLHFMAEEDVIGAVFVTDVTTGQRVLLIETQGSAVPGAFWSGACEEFRDTRVLETV